MKKNGKIKKLFVSATVAGMVFTMTSMTAFAGNHGNGHDSGSGHNNENHNNSGYSSNHNNSGNYNAVPVTPAVVPTTPTAVPVTPVSAVCPIQGCSQTGQHSHDGRYYNTHFNGDGHPYHSYCDVADCTVGGYHGDSYYFGHDASDGHSYHGYCEISDCTLTGYHGHDGAYGFGHSESDGHGNHNSGNHE